MGSAMPTAPRTLTEDERYQNERIIAVYEPDQIPCSHKGVTDDT